MGRRDKERIERIQEGKEEPIRNEKPVLSEKVIKRVEGVVNKVAGKVFKDKGLDGNAASLLKGLPMVRSIPGGVEKVRNDVLRAAGTDIESAINKGLTDEQILQPAMDSAKYKLLLKELGLDFEHLKAIIRKIRSDK